MEPLNNFALEPQDVAAELWCPTIRLQLRVEPDLMTELESISFSSRLIPERETPRQLHSPHRLQSDLRCALAATPIFKPSPTFPMRLSHCLASVESLVPSSLEVTLVEAYSPGRGISFAYRGRNSEPRASTAFSKTAIACQLRIF